MRVYLAGPMRGKLHWNFPAFDEAADRWRNAGHHVFSPATVIRALGYPCNDDDPTSPDDPAHYERLRHVLLSDVGGLINCDALVLLPDWQQSTGATFEVAAAQFLGLSIYDAITMEPLVIQSKPWVSHVRKLSKQEFNNAMTSLQATRSSREMVCIPCNTGNHHRCKNSEGGLICLCLSCKSERQVPQEATRCTACVVGNHGHCGRQVSGSGILCECSICWA